MKKKKCKLVGDFVMGDLLGEGSYGKVCKSEIVINN